MIKGYTKFALRQDMSALSSCWYLPLYCDRMLIMKQTAKPDVLSLRKRILVLGVGLFLLAFWPAAAAEITIDRMEMASRGRVNDGEFVVSSLLSADLALSGGYKYSFLLGFSLEAPDIARAFAYRNLRFDPLLPIDPPGGGVTEDDYNALVDRYNTQSDMINNQAVLGFRIAKATVRDVFGLPLELSYFLGAGDDFCSGDDFVPRFGISPFGTDFRGFLYFPDGIGGNPTRRYNGIYGVRGTGFSLGLTKWESFIPILYLYQDFPYFSGFINGTGITENLYSGDLRLLFCHDSLRFEFFGGLSLNSSLDTNIRGGLMAHLLGNGVEFFVQGGIPGWTTGEKFSIDNIFFLIEPRLHLNPLSLYVTFFYHPVEYLHIITPDEKGKANINIKFLFGNTESGLSGGLETGGDLKVHETENFLFYITPLGTFISGGLRWDAKIRIRPLDYDVPGEMFDFFIGVRTAF